MRTVTKTYHIHGPVDAVWDAFVNPKTIDRWGGGHAVMEEAVGKKFSLWGGDIRGTNTEVVPHKKIVQDWYSGNWTEPSVVTFTFTQEKDAIRVDLLHENVPDGYADDIEKGWQEYYLGPIKQLVEQEAKNTKRG
ncbi:MAG: SRPBCC domain-containing protein [Candidatus Levybacteria bacterium]|nr:SRPBCC domain-containing protein [Candidatus Levybacteria bacterium]